MNQATNIDFLCNSNTIKPQISFSVIAKQIGVDSALFLQKIRYWLKKCGRIIRGEKGVWIYNSLTAWKDQFPYMSEYKIRKSIKHLEDLGMIKSKKVNAAKWNHTKWYTINFEKYYSLAEKIPSTQLNKKNTNKNNETTADSGRLKKSSDRSDENQQIINVQKNNYTNKNSLPLNSPLSTPQKKENQEERRGKIEKLEEANLSNQTKSTTKPTTQSDLKKTLQKGTNAEKLPQACGERGTPHAPDIQVAQKMLQVWNSKIAKDTPTSLSKKRAKKLQQAFEKHFDSNLKDWEDFLGVILQSQFLLGNVTNFKISLDFAIDEERLLKIKEGTYHSCDEWSRVKAKQEQRLVISQIQNDLVDGTQWKDMKLALLSEFGEATFVSWFSKLKFKGVENKALQLQTSSGFVKNYLDTHFSRKMQKIAGKFFGETKKVCFVVSGGNQVRNAENCMRRF